MIHPVPDKAALQRGVLVDGVPILLQAAHAVAHGMAILRHDIGACAVVLQFLVGVARCRRGLGADKGIVQRAPLAAIIRQIVHRGVHHLHHVRIPVQLGALVGHRAGIVQPFQIAVGMLGGHPVAAFVAQRPGYHRGVVAVAVQHVVHPVLHRGCPFLLLG